MADYICHVCNNRCSMMGHWKDDIQDYSCIPQKKERVVAKKRKDRFDYFRAMTRQEQRENILSVSELCIDAAPVSLARKIEIYLEGELR